MNESDYDWRQSEETEKSMWDYLSASEKRMWERYWRESKAAHERTDRLVDMMLEQLKQEKARLI